MPYLNNSRYYNHRCQSGQAKERALAAQTKLISGQQQIQALQKLLPRVFHEAHTLPLVQRADQIKAFGVSRDLQKQESSGIRQNVVALEDMVLHDDGSNHSSTSSSFATSQSQQQYSAHQTLSQRLYSLTDQPKSQSQLQHLRVYRMENNTGLPNQKPVHNINNMKENFPDMPEHVYQRLVSENQVAKYPENCQQGESSKKEQDASLAVSKSEPKVELFNLKNIWKPDHVFGSVPRVSKFTLEQELALLYPDLPWANPQIWIDAIKSGDTLKDEESEAKLHKQTIGTQPEGIIVQKKDQTVDDLTNEEWQRLSLRKIWAQKAKIEQLRTLHAHNKKVFDQRIPRISEPRTIEQKALAQKLDALRQAQAQAHYESRSKQTTPGAPSIISPRPSREFLPSATPSFPPSANTPQLIINNAFPSEEMLARLPSLTQSETPDIDNLHDGLNYPRQVYQLPMEENLVMGSRPGSRLQIPLYTIQSRQQTELAIQHQQHLHQQQQQQRLIHEQILQQQQKVLNHVHQPQYQPHPQLNTNPFTNPSPKQFPFTGAALPYTRPPLPQNQYGENVPLPIPPPPQLQLYASQPYQQPHQVSQSNSPMSFHRQPTIQVGNIPQPVNRGSTMISLPAIPISQYYRSQ